LDYWTREKNDAAAAAKAAAEAAAAAAKAKADIAAAGVAKDKATAITYESGKVWQHSLNWDNSSYPFNLKDEREKDFKASATDISDNTHHGEHWDGPKRGRIIRNYRKAMDSCNISGTSKCTFDALGAHYPTAYDEGE
jgi:hypothetical protein